MEKHMKNANQQLKIMIGINDKINEIFKKSQNKMVDAQIQTDDPPRIIKSCETCLSKLSMSANNSFLNVNKKSSNSSRSMSIHV
jgi:hypothetical protein